MPSEMSTIDGDRSVQELRRELAEAREQQAATAEILRVISRSPMDLQRVFADIAASAARLCAAYDATIFQADRDFLRIVAHHGPIPSLPVGDISLPLTREVATGRAVLDQRTIHVADLLAETAEYPASSNRARLLGFRAIVAVPLMRAGAAIGAITLRRTEARLFTDKQIALLETFANQAVIGIESARLLDELRQSLQQQTATADVLKAISRATFDLPRILDTLVGSAASLCDAFDAAILQKDGNFLRIVSHRGHIPSLGPVGQGTLPLTRGTSVGRAVLDRQMLHLADAQSETDEYPEESAIARRLGFRTLLAIPLLGAGEAVGAITLRRSEVLSHRGQIPSIGAVGQATLPHDAGCATLATKRTLLLTWAGLPPAGSHQLCLAHSFDHLVGAGEQRRRHSEAERFRSLEVDHELILGRLLHGQVGGFGTPEDFVDVNCRTSV